MKSLAIIVFGAIAELVRVDANASELTYLDKLCHNVPQKSCFACFKFGFELGKSK